MTPRAAASAAAAGTLFVITSARRCDYLCMPTHASGRAAGALLVSLWASASPASASVALDYRIEDAAQAAACPSRDAFIGALHARGVRLDAPQARSRARAVQIVIRKDDGAFRGELVVQRDDAPRAEPRRVHDVACSEVAEALAVSTAIALGGRAASTTSELAPEAHALDDEPRAREPAPGEGSEAPAGEPASSEPPSSERVDVDASRPARLRGSSFDARDAVEVEAGTLELGAVRAYTVSAGAQLGLLPGQVVPRFELEAMLTGFATPPGAEPFLTGPLLQIQWAVLGPTDARYRGVALDAWGLEAGIDLCQALRYDSEGLSASLCAGFGAGWLFTDVTAASGENASRELGYGYASLGLESHYDLGAGFHLAAKLGGRLRTPLAPEAPDGTRLFESSTWEGFGTLGVGLHFR